MVGSKGDKVKRYMRNIDYLDYLIGFHSAFLLAKQVVETNNKETAITHLKNIIWEIEVTLKDETLHTLKKTQ